MTTYHLDNENHRRYIMFRWNNSTKFANYELGTSLTLRLTSAKRQYQQQLHSAKRVARQIDRWKNEIKSH